jgi:dTDP-4-dehydrorhamnose reductase
LKKILVTGASGLLGSKLTTVLSKNRKVTPTYNTHVIDENSMKMDIADKSAISKIFEMIQPDTVVHTAAMTNVDKCEINRDLAWSINVQGTENIAEKCAEVDANGVDPSTMRTLENKHLLRGVSYAT